MELSNEIIIITPTYNRKSTLPKLYRSLISQNKKDFVWLIVDDGSSDGTREYVENISKENKVRINYIYQNNGGKGRALNKAFSFFENTSLFVVVDSDDYLLNDAIERIQRYVDKYKDIQSIGALFFHYKTEDGKIIKPIGNIITEDKVMTRYEYNNQYIQNDGCVCYFGKAVKKYKYPEFEGEKYVGPTVIQLLMASEYRMVFSPEVIGVAEYQDGGLTKNGRSLRLRNPQGMIYYSRLMMDRKALLKTQIKYAISIWPYSIVAKKRFMNIVKYVKRPFLSTVTFIPGKILYLFWKLSNK
jgi:glycosyltransferase involved in cell wall biosynthesis